MCAVNKAAIAIDRYKNQADKQHASETEYIADLDVLEKDNLD